MSMPEKGSPFDKLLNINQLYIQSEANLPEHQRVQASTWVGIRFRLGQYYLVIAIENLEEIITELPYTTVPIVKAWLKGIANMRGHLLPVIDLNKLFGITPHIAHKQSRVMAVKAETNYVGFLVDAVFGIQQFSIENQLDETPDVPDSLRPFITGIYEGEQQKWLIFDTASFMTSSQFLAVGAMVI